MRKEMKRAAAMFMAAGLMTTSMCGQAVFAEGEKQDLIMTIDVRDEGFTQPILDKITEKFGDQYNLIFKTWSNGPDSIQAIKTAALADEQMDLIMYWPNNMIDFVQPGLAVALDDYLTDEWKGRFSPGALDIGTIDGSVYNLAYSTVYPMVIVNKELAEQSGYTLSEDGKWTWDEFLEFSKAVNENTDAMGSVIPKGWTPWLTRNGYMQVWDNDEDLAKWNAGEVSFLSDEIVAMSDLVVDAFKNDVFYPGGDASLAIENDEAYAAMASGKAASIFVVNSLTLQVLDQTGLGDNYVIMDWPAMGTNPTNPVLGGCNGYFIPTTAKNIDGAVAVLDYLTSEEIATIRGEAGCVSTVRLADSAQVDADLMAQISRCSDSITTEITGLSPEISSELEKFPANYYYYGKDSLQELDDLRLEAIGE